jgi:SulP family sulfate permease
LARTRYVGEVRDSPLRALPAAALRAVLREGYSRADLRSDLLAGAVVGIVALPLAMALAVAVGVPPQHGLYTAVVAGFVCAVLGGSRTQVSGPTAAFVVILAPIYVRFGLAGLLISGALGGLILIALGLARLGRLIQFIPHPVTTGFTAGIATVIATLQLKDLFGLQLAANPEHFLERLGAMLAAAPSASPYELAIGVLTLALLLALPRLLPRLPAPLIALPCGALLALLLERFVPGVHIATIASRFQGEIDGLLIHGVPQLPPLPLLPWQAPGPAGGVFTLDLATLRALVPGAFAIAMLGAIESLLSAVVADGMARTRHDPDAELLAQGVGNLLVPFFGGIPATGAIARTATNIRFGARSPIAAMTHALVVLAVMLSLAPLLGYLPMSALAGLLLLVAWRMSEIKHFAHTLRVAPLSDVVVLLACYGLTVVFDMILGVTVGLVLAALLFMRRMAEVSHVRLVSPEQLALREDDLPPGTAVYEVSGPLFFGAAQKAMSTLSGIGTRVRAVVLVMEGVSVIDATGLVALESALDALARQRCIAILTAVQEQPAALLARARLTQRENVRLCADVAEALAVARSHVAGLTPSLLPGAPSTPASSSPPT